MGGGVGPGSEATAIESQLKMQQQIDETLRKLGSLVDNSAKTMANSFGTYNTLATNLNQGIDALVTALNNNTIALGGRVGPSTNDAIRAVIGPPSKEPALNRLANIRAGRE